MSHNEKRSCQDLQTCFKLKCVSAAERADPSLDHVLLSHYFSFVFKACLLVYFMLSFSFFFFFLPTLAAMMAGKERGLKTGRQISYPPKILMLAV